MTQVNNTNNNTNNTNNQANNKNNNSDVTAIIVDINDKEKGQQITHVIVVDNNNNDKPDKQKTQKKQKKQKLPVNDNDKKNTDAWKQKQAQKKKQKQQKEKLAQATQSANVQTKQDKKQKKKKEKDTQNNTDNVAKQEQKEQQKKDKDKKVQSVSQPSNKKQKQVPKKQQKKGKQKQKANTQKTNPIQKQKPKKQKLNTVQTLIIPKYPLLLDNRTAQIQLIQKQVINLIRPRNTILHLGKLGLKIKIKLNNQGKDNKLELNSGCGKNNFSIVEIPGYYCGEASDSEIVCRYEDISYLICEQIDKIFIQAEVVFQNGSALIPKGFENISLLANYYNKPIVIVCGSWHYSRISISSYDQLESLYGEQITDKYDWINYDCIELICMQFGSMLPCQVGCQVEQGYKNYGILTTEW